MQVFASLCSMCRSRGAQLLIRSDRFFVLLTFLCLECSWRVLCFSASSRFLWTTGLVCVWVAPPPPLPWEFETKMTPSSSLLFVSFFLYSRTAVFRAAQSRKSLSQAGENTLMNLRWSSWHHINRQQIGPSNTGPR